MQVFRLNGIIALGIDPRYTMGIVYFSNVLFVLFVVMPIELYNSF